MCSSSEKGLRSIRKLLSIGMLKGPGGSLFLFCMRRLKRGLRMAETQREIRMMKQVSIFFSLWLGKQSHRNLISSWIGLWVSLKGMDTTCGRGQKRKMLKGVLNLL